MYFFLLIVLPVSLYSSYLPFLLPVSLYSSYLSFLFLFCNIFTSTALPLSISLTHALPLSLLFTLYTLPNLYFLAFSFFPLSRSLPISLLLSLPLPLPLSLSLSSPVLRTLQGLDLHGNSQPLPLLWYLTIFV